MQTSLSRGGGVDGQPLRRGRAYAVLLRRPEARGLEGAQGPHDDVETPWGQDTVKLFGNDEALKKMPENLLAERVPEGAISRTHPHPRPARVH